MLVKELIELLQTMPEDSEDFKERTPKCVVLEPIN